MDLSDAATAWRRDGFVVLPGYLDGPDLSAAQRDLAAVYPTAADYHAAPDQGGNRTYTGLNHTPLVSASGDLRWRGLEMFIWLSDVPEDHGPTHIVPLPVTAGVPALPHGYLRAERPDFSPPGHPYWTA